MKRLLILTLVLIMFALPASAMLIVLDPSVSAELQLIARTQVATERNIPLAQVVAGETWLMDLRGIETKIYVIPLIIGQEKLTAHVRVHDKAILTEAQVEALKADDAAKAGATDRIATTMAITTTGAVVTTEAAPEAGIPLLTYALFGGLTTLAVGVGLFVLRNKFR